MCSIDFTKISLAHTLISKDTDAVLEDVHASQCRRLDAVYPIKDLCKTNQSLFKASWAFDSHRIAVRFAYEWHDAENNWFRSYGNENWQFDANGLMALRYAGINDLAIEETECKFFWVLNHRPDDYASLSDLGL